MQTLKLELPLRPIAWQRAGGKGNRRFTRPASRAFRQQLQHAVIAELASRGPFTFPIFGDDSELAVDIVAGPTRGDKDNVAKAIYDALNGMLWADDKQITRGATEVYRKGKAKIALEVRER